MSLVMVVKNDRSKRLMGEILLTNRWHWLDDCSPLETIFTIF